MKLYSDFTAFYNGPTAGASIPDHMHFQACPLGSLPLEREADRLLDTPDARGLEYLTTVKEAELFHFKKFAKGIFLLRARTPKSVTKLFYRLLDCASRKEGEAEPRFNLFTWIRNGEYRALVIFREKHRSRHYFQSGPDHLAMSPGCVDMAGLFIAPRADDFAKLDSRLLDGMIAEVTIDAAEKNPSSGVWSDAAQTGGRDPLRQRNRLRDSLRRAGLQRVSYSGGKISYNGALYDELVSKPRPCLPFSPSPPSFFTG